MYMTRFFFFWCHIMYHVESYYQFPNQGLNLCSLQKVWVPTSGPPGKFLSSGSGSQFCPINLWFTYSYSSTLSLPTSQQVTYLILGAGQP